MPSRRSLNGSEESLGSRQLVDTQARLRPQDRPVPHKCECEIDPYVVDYGCVYKYFKNALMYLNVGICVKLSIHMFNLASHYCIYVLCSCM